MTKQVVKLLMLCGGVVAAQSITGLSPSSAFVGTQGFVNVTVAGNNFYFPPGTGVLAAYKSVVLLNGLAQPTAVISSNSIVFELDAFNDQALANVGILSVVVQNPGSLSNSVPFAVIPPPLVPSINPGGIVNNADSAGTVAPGGIVSAYGVFPLNTPVVCQASPLGVCAAKSAPLPTTLSGLSMQFSGIPVPLFYADEFIVNGQVPWELGGQSTAQAVVNVNNQTGLPQTVHLAAYSPAIFTMSSPLGTPVGAILDSNYQPVNIVSNSENGLESYYSVVPGDVIQIYCTGLGPVTHQPATGVATPITPLATTTTMPIVTIGGANATVLFSGLTPTAVGLYQVNVIVPNAGSTTNVYGSFRVTTITLTIGEVESNTVIMPYCPTAACRN